MTVQAWRDEAACLGRDPAIWYPERGQSVDAAVQICRQCPVQVQCAEYGLSLGPLEPGVWGGMSWRERRRVLRGQTPRARELKPPAACGTVAGYNRHRRLGEQACEACREGARVYHRERYHQIREEGVS